MGTLPQRTMHPHCQSPSCSPLSLLVFWVNSCPEPSFHLGQRLIEAGSIIGSIIGIRELAPFAGSAHRRFAGSAHRRLACQSSQQSEIQTSRPWKLLCGEVEEREAWGWKVLGSSSALGQDRLIIYEADLSHLHYFTIRTVYYFSHFCAFTGQSVYWFPLESLMQPSSFGSKVTSLMCQLTAVGCGGLGCVHMASHPLKDQTGFLT